MVSKKTNNRKPYILLIVLILVVAGGSVFYYAKYYHHNKNMVADTASSKKPIEATPSKPTKTQVATTPATNPGGSVNENGQTPSSLPPSSDWVSSSSGDITLQLPTENTTVETGDTISGTATVSSVNYILSDTSVGEIDQGTLPVVNGRFSGKMEFSTSAPSGTLQVYYANPSNGAEEDLVEINVNF